MDLVSEKWFLHSFRNKLFWIRCDDLKINHPINETSVEAAEFSGHVKMKDSEGAWCILPLDQLDYKKNTLSRQFEDTLKSRTKFIDKCLELLEEISQGPGVGDMSSEQTNVESTSRENSGKNMERASSSLYGNKIVADCIDVHISNMVGPDEERQCRPVDPRHVERLKAQYKRSTTSLVVLAGMITEPDVDINRMWEAKVTSVETLGGNHTRLAIQGLLESSDITDAQAVVKVRLYRDLTKVEALQIGYLHNKQAANSKDLSFFDKIRIMRPLLYGVEAKSAELTARKDKVRIIFDLKNITELNNNYKTHMFIARSGPVLYKLALEVDKQWNDGQIKGQPKKVEPLKQTKFTGLNNKKVPEAEKEEALRLFLREGLKPYETVTNAWKPKKKTLTETEDILTDVADGERVPDDVQDAVEDDANEPVISNSFEDDNEVLRSENTRLREENERLKEDNATLRKQLEDLKKKVTEKGKQTNYMSSLQMKRKSDASTATVSSDPPKQAKLNVLPQRAELEVGDRVWARYSVDGKEYEAEILKKNKNGSYKVRYPEDDVRETVREKDLRPYT